MQDFSYLVAICSKELQRFDVLPHYAMDVYNKLKKQLQHGKESFQIGQTPSVFSIKKGNDTKEYNVWKNFKESISKILDDQTYKDIRLLLPSERGRVTSVGPCMVVIKKATKISLMPDLEILQNFFSHS